MYGIFTNICPKNHPNVGKYTIHGSYGLDFIPMKPEPDPHVTSIVSNGSHPADPPFLLTPISGYYLPVIHPLSPSSENVEWPMTLGFLRVYFHLLHTFIPIIPHRIIKIPLKARSYDHLLVITGYNWD